MKKVLHEIWNFIILFFIGFCIIIGFILFCIIYVINWLYKKIFNKKDELIPINKWLDKLDNILD